MDDDLPADLFDAELDRIEPAKEAGRLDVAEQLALQQLLQLRFWFDERTAVRESTDGLQEAATETIPVRWELTKSITLHDWQRECVDRWFAAGRRGVIKVVTGAGKTLLALAIAERLQNSHVQDLHVAIVVPTVVLLTQWIDEIREKSNLPPTAIGCIGAGRSDQFSERVRILVCVINSASKKLPSEVERAAVAQRLLLVVDECHRAGAPEMRHVFEAKRAFSLGLSATPERDDVPDEDVGALIHVSINTPDFAASETGRELGPVIYEMTYAEAIERGVLPPFRVAHYGLSLDNAELAAYERISREIKDLRNALETPNRRGLALIRWCRSKLGRGSPRAQHLLALMGRRKQLLYRMRERGNAVETILRQHFARDEEAKAILFHESIHEVMVLFRRLWLLRLPVVAEHSEMPDALRAESLRLFRAGSARIIVSARSLIEGFNVPSADVGIIVAASSSVRQRVQTLGRLLRKDKRAHGADKVATLHVLYAAGTVDELVYEKADWDRLIGAERNEYFTWSNVEASPPSRRPGPPRRPMPSESDLELGSLVVAQMYPGNPEEGRVFTQDTQGTIRDEAGALLEAHPELSTLLHARPGAGRFRVTPKHLLVHKLEKTSEGWRSVYLGRLHVAPTVATGDGRLLGPLQPGDPYPLSRAKGRTFSVLQRDRRLIAEKTPTGIRFVVPADELQGSKATSLRSIQEQLARAHQLGRRVSKVIVTEEGHVVYVANNEAFFIGDAPEGSDGFTFEKREGETQ